jgi:hypothetical protein
MFCIFCKYTSFDYLPSCPRCGKDWTQSKKALNLDWVVASAPERRHQRQVPENEAGSGIPSSLSGSDQNQKEPREIGNEARTASPQFHFEPQKRPEMSENDGGEDELDFPDLTTLLHPQAPSQNPEQAQTEPPDPADMTRPEKSEPRGAAEKKAENDEILDLSSLVHDLGLEVDEPEDSENRSQSSPVGSKVKSSNPSQG